MCVRPGNRNVKRVESGRGVSLRKNNFLSEEAVKNVVQKFFQSDVLDIYHQMFLFLLLLVVYSQATFFQNQFVLCQFFNRKGICKRTRFVVANTFTGKN